MTREERVERRVAMELSSIGDQVFAVESITKKRVRKVGSALLTQLVFPWFRVSSRSDVASRPHGATKLGYAVSPLYCSVKLNAASRLA